jgi:outer membrane receptor protein involved in Fe transport
VPGPQITASYSVPVATLTQALGRPPSSGSPAIVQLIAPGTLYGDRVYQLDSRLSKTWRVGRMRIQGQLNAYNLLNVGPVLAVNNTFGATYLNPTATLQGRMFKFGAQLDW